MNWFGKRFFALALSLLFTVALLEIVVRLLPPPTQYSDTSVDNLFDGYRLPEDWAAPRRLPETVRVLVLGDSFTWGDGVHEEDAYPYRMQFRMNLYDPEGSYEVLNAGRNGLNTADQRELIDTMKLLDSEPDLVLVGFSLNDSEPSERRLAMKMKEPLARRLPVGRVERRLLERSKLLQFVYGRLENTRQRRATNEYVARLFDPESVHWQACEEALASIRDLLAAKGVPLLVAVLPAFDAPFDSDYPYRRHHEQVMATLARLGIASVDLLSLYDGVETRRLVVTPFTDAHPNELAHRIAADFLAARVLECLEVEGTDKDARRSRWNCSEGDRA